MLKNYAVWKNNLEALLNIKSKIVSVIIINIGFKYVYTHGVEFDIILDVYILVGNNLNNT